MAKVTEAAGTYILCPANPAAIAGCLCALDGVAP